LSAVEAEAVLMPLPQPSIETEPFWAAVQERRLIMPKCDACGKISFPPTVACPACGGDKFTWTEMSGRGKVYSFVVYHRVYHPSLTDKVPYVVALIELEEGPRIISNVVGMPIEEVTCEMPVQVLYEEVRDGYLIPKFARR
jgi:uncharacterized OB-fold protein